MKYANGKEPLKNDAIICPDGNGGVIVGNVNQLYERSEQLTVFGYPLRLKASDCVLASDAYEAVTPKPVE